MKVILLRDVAKIGRRHQVVEVPDGYAQNQLIPKKWAEPATGAALKRITSAAASNEAASASEAQRYAAAVAELQTTPLLVAVKDANQHGHLFKAVHEADIAAAAAQRGLNLPKQWVVCEGSIKSLGEHTVWLVHGSERASCIINVTTA